MSKKVKRDFEEIFLKYDGEKRPFRVFLELYRDNWIGVCLSVVFFVLKNMPVWVLPMITASIINTATGTAGNSGADLATLFVLGCTLILLNIPMQQTETYFTSKVIRDVEMRLRSALTRKLQHLTISFHKSFLSGRIQSKMLRDVESVEQLSRAVIITLLQSLVNIVIVASVTLTKSRLVSMFFVLTIPVATLLIRIFRGSIGTRTNVFRKEIESMASDVTEMVEMIPVTKAHGLEKVEEKRLDKQFVRVKKAATSVDHVQTFFGSSSWVAFNLFQFICLCFTGYLAYNGKIPAGDIALYQSYFASLLGSVSTLATLYPAISKGTEAVTSLSEILASKDIENNVGKTRLRKIDGEYTFENVSFYYPDENNKYVIKNFSMNVKKGECIAFVGESGSGKSTLLNLLIGFNFPAEGKLLVDGHDITHINLTQYRKHIAVVSQNNILFSGTVKDNITYGMTKILKKELDEVIKQANLTEVIRELPDGIYTNVGEHGGRLSGGQKQRIAIARAMIRKPDIIILDEATSALDNVSEFKVQKAMDELMRGRTSFIVAHRLSTIRNADRIVVMKNGECVEMGTYDELIAKKGEFYKLERMQNRNVENIEQGE